MRVVFMGTPAFAVPSLEALRQAHDVVLVVTRPDAVAGRGGHRRPSEVKAAALAAGLPVLECTSLRGEPNARIAEARPDVICVAAFGVLLPRDTLSVPPLGCINVHASLLPRYRGAAPVQRSVLAGDAETGVSIMLMEEGLDTGPYVLQRSVPVDERSACEIEEDLARVGAVALIEALGLIERCEAVWTPQDDSRATYAAKITKDDVALSPELTVAEAFARVRAATRRAPARVCVGETELTVVGAHRDASTSSPAAASPAASSPAAPASCLLAPGAASFARGALALGFADGSLILDVVRPAGKGDMDAAAWARGARLPGAITWRGTR